MANKDALGARTKQNYENMPFWSLSATVGFTVMNAFHCTDGNNGQTVYWPDPQKPYSRENLDCFGTEGK